jgi:hypothetical protein
MVHRDRGDPVTGFEITHAERAGWQRRATRELAAILDTHRELPIIAWTVVPAASTLVGHVNGLGGADEVRQAFDTWRAALALGEDTETSSGSATVYLRAVARRNRVRLALTATVFEDHAEAVRR